MRSRKGRGYGPVRIRAELLERGLEAGLIEAYLEPRSREWVTIAREQYAKRYGEGVPEEYAERARRMRFLAQRGFAQEQIRAVLKGD